MIKYIFSTLLMLVSLPVYAEEPKPTHMSMERVIDGDTLVASGKKIRLWGIDAPEKGEALYKISTMYLTTILKEDGLACKFIEKDRYKRDVMQCFIGSHDIGSMMVLMGRCYKKIRSL